MSLTSDQFDNMTTEDLDELFLKQDEEREN
jgi:hypothetical protein